MVVRDRPRCRHCHSAPVSRSRGLCWACFYDPAIRQLYPRFFVPTSVPDGFGDRPLPDRPTRAAPGSPEKVEVLCRRARLRQTLWYPEDACE